MSSTLHLFTDLFRNGLPPTAALFHDEALYAVPRWGVELAAGRGAPTRVLPHLGVDIGEDWIDRRTPRGCVPVIVTDGFCTGCGRAAPLGRAGTTTWRSGRGRRHAGARCARRPTVARGAVRNRRRWLVAMAPCVGCTYRPRCVVGEGVWCSACDLARTKGTDLCTDRQERYACSHQSTRSAARRSRRCCAAAKCTRGCGAAQSPAASYRAISARCRGARARGEWRPISSPVDPAARGAGAGGRGSRACTRRARAARSEDRAEPAWLYTGARADIRHSRRSHLTAYQSCTARTRRHSEASAASGVASLSTL